MAILTESPIRLDPLIDQVRAPDRGGIAIFLGLVRDHHQGKGVLGLDYSAYGPMAETVTQQVIEEVAGRGSRVAVVVQHRIGALTIGDIAVAVVAASAHRAEAFDACRYVIEELKKRVPVWKKEMFVDGTVEWVDPTASRVESQESRVGTHTMRSPTLNSELSTLDSLGRPLGSLRISVTDRCNLRCAYCMPEEHYVWLPKQSLLTFEEITRLARIFVELGASKLRLTGGEPLLRHDLSALVGMLAKEAQPQDLAMTTNGVLLGPQIAGLRSAGLERVTVSLDTMSPTRLEKHARTTRHADIVAGIEAAVATGMRSVKINTVVIRGFNDDELVDLLEFGKRVGAEVRFIEYMDVGGATRWSMNDVVSQDEILERLGAHYGTVSSSARQLVSTPSQDFTLPDGTKFGIIASTTQPFCRDCDRGRLTADGTLFLCLYAREGLDLREPLRSGASDSELSTLISGAWRARDDRGAEKRLEVAERGALVSLEGLRADPHKEMHTRGG